MNDIAVFYITAPDADTADAIAETLVVERLAACVNIIPEMRSVYRWDGEIQTGEELVIIAKGSLSRADELRETVARMHPDDTPCIVALPVSDAASSAPFLAWVRDETEPKRH